MKAVSLSCIFILWRTTFLLSALMTLVSKAAKANDIWQISVLVLSYFSLPFRELQVKLVFPLPLNLTFISTVHIDNVPGSQHKI